MTPDQLTTEREVWRYLARCWARYLKTWKRGSDERHMGLCYQVRKLGLPESLGDECRATLQRYSLHNNIDPAYFWPLTKAGAKRRLTFCRKQIAK